MNKEEQNFRVVHLFPYSFFINTYYSFLCDNYDISQHRIVLYRKADLNREEIDDDIIIRYKGKKDIIRLRRLLNAADRIVIHSLGIEIEMLVLLFVERKFCQKAVWIVWGSDLYCKREKDNSFISNMIEKIRKTIIGRLPYIGCLVVGDYELAIKWYKTNAKMIRVNYSDKSEKKIVDSIKASTKRKDVINILVGNSGTPSNGHKEVYEKLLKWKNHSICIHIPLAYGKKEYIEEIAKLYKEEFREKVVVLDKIVPLEDYLYMLSEMDIGIFNNDRQQALGNIFALLYMGKKVYLKKGTSMWDELTEVQGAMLYDCDEISNDSFVKEWPTDEMKKVNMDVADRLRYNESVIKDGWDKVFSV